MLTAAVLIAALLAILFLASRFFPLVAAAIVALAGHEWARLCKLKLAWLYATVVLAVSCLLYFSPEDIRRAALIAAAAFWMIPVPWWLARGVPRAAVLAHSGLIALAPAALAMAILPPRELLAVLILIWIADTAAYFVGRAIGRRKLAPSISPGKTWEGALGGVAGAIAWAIIAATLIEGAPWVPVLAAAALLAVLSIVGDLFESAVKRQAGAKDSGTLLPGHGGVLDRIDSAAAVLPVAALMLAVAR